MLYRRTALGSISTAVLLAAFVVLGLDSPASLCWALSLHSHSHSSALTKQPLAAISRSSRSRQRIQSTTTRRRMSASTITTDSTTTTTTSSFRVLGVAGGIGSGKSTACKLLVDSCGCLAHIDADKVAHSVYAPGSQAVHDVVSEFGKGVLACDENNNAAIQPLEIDRKKLGPIVFADRSAMARLERIVWPHVKDKLAQKIGELKVSWNNSNSNPDATDATTTTKPRPIVVLEAAILLDAGWDDLLDGVWVVTVPRERALTRLVETRGLTEAEAAKRIDAQNRSRGIGTLADEVSNGVVQCVIENSKSLDDLAKTLTASLEDPSCWK